MGAVAFLASLVAPPRCVACAVASDWRAPLCERCGQLLASAAAQHTAPAALDGSWAAASYDGVAAELVVALKFRRLLSAAGPMAGRMAAAPAELLHGVLVPVPPSPARLRRRGFDPAALLAAELSRRCGLPLSPYLRRSDGPRQVGRPRAERIGNPPAVSAMGPAPGTAVLVDDVQTTGATLSACARALRAAGATRVTAITFASKP